MAKSPSQIATLLLAFALVGALAESTLPAVSGQEPVVASFDAEGAAPEPSEKPEQTAKIAADGPLVSFNFRFAPWDEVLKLFAELADLTLDLDEVPPGTFNYFDSNRYTPRQALDILNGYLLQRGYVLVQRDRFLVCVNLAKGIPPNLVPLVPVDDLSDYGRNSLLTIILPVERGDAQVLAGEIEPLLGQPQGKLSVLRSANALVVTDIGANLRVISELLRRGMFESHAESVGGESFRIFTMSHIRAGEAERLIREFFRLPAAGNDTPASTDGLRITTDLRMNRLFAAGSSGDLALVEQIVDALDTESAGQGQASGTSHRTIRILPLAGADIIIIGQALQALTPRIKVSTTRSQSPPASAGGPDASDQTDPAAKQQPASDREVGAEGRDR